MTLDIGLSLAMAFGGVLVVGFVIRNTLKARRRYRQSERVILAQCPGAKGRLTSLGFNTCNHPVELYGQGDLKVFVDDRGWYGRDSQLYFGIVFRHASPDFRVLSHNGNTSLQQLSPDPDLPDSLPQLINGYATLNFSDTTLLDRIKTITDDASIELEAAADRVLLLFPFDGVLSEADFNRYTAAARQIRALLPVKPAAPAPTRH